MKKKSNLKGFTVLEFLVVVAIMMILIALILVGLTRARTNAQDQSKVANIQTIVVGVQQFYDVCRVYPANLESNETCDDLSANSLDLSSFISNVDAYNFNDSGSPYVYTGLMHPSDPNQACVGFHIGVTLEGGAGDVMRAKSGIDSTGSQQPCAGTGGSLFDGTDGQVFDIFVDPTR